MDAVTAIRDPISPHVIRNPPRPRRQGPGEGIKSAVCGRTPYLLMLN